MMIDKPPEKIYLQFYGDGSPDDIGEVSDEDVTWCTDKQFAQDIEYIQCSTLDRLHNIEKSAYKDGYNQALIDIIDCTKNLSQKAKRK
jgi:hypothetical protein